MTKNKVYGSKLRRRVTHLYNKRKLTFCFLPVLFLVARLIFLLNYNIVITFLFFSICIYILEVFSLFEDERKVLQISLFSVWDMITGDGAFVDVPAVLAQFFVQ